VPLLCPGGTVAILASGPSLVREDIDAVLAAGATTVAINDAIRLAPDAAVFYSGARAWWPRWTQQALWGERHRLVNAFAGVKISLCIDQDKPGVLPDGTILLANTGNDGLELRPVGLRTYQNSGGAAINLAMHLGASRVLLLGYDMGPDASGRHHFHEEHRTRHSSPYAMFRNLIQTMVLPLHAAGVEVINCSRASQLPCFPRKPLMEVLAAC
jgi:transposase